LQPEAAPCVRHAAAIAAYAPANPPDEPREAGGPDREAPAAPAGGFPGQGAAADAEAWAEAVLDAGEGDVVPRAPAWEGEAALAGAEARLLALLGGPPADHEADGTAAGGPPAGRPEAGTSAAVEAAAEPESPPVAEPPSASEAAAAPATREAWVQTPEADDSLGLAQRVRILRASSPADDVIQGADAGPAADDVIEATGAATTPERPQSMDIPGAGAGHAEEQGGRAEDTAAGAAGGGDATHRDPASSDEAAAPSDEAAAPSDEAAASSDEAAAPSDEAAAPSDEAAAPSDEAAASSDEAAAPSDEAAASSDEAAAPSGAGTAAGDPEASARPEQQTLRAASASTPRPELERSGLGPTRAAALATPAWGAEHDDQWAIGQSPVTPPRTAAAALPTPGTSSVERAAPSVAWAGPSGRTPLPAVSAFNVRALEEAAASDDEDDGAPAASDDVIFHGASDPRASWEPAPRPRGQAPTPTGPVPAFRAEWTPETGRSGRHESPVALSPALARLDDLRFAPARGRPAPPAASRADRFESLRARISGALGLLA